MRDYYQLMQSLNSFLSKESVPDSVTELWREAVNIKV